MAEIFSFSHVEAIAGADLRGMCPKCMGARGPCKVKIIPDIQKNWIKLTLPCHPPPYQFFLWKLIIIKDYHFGGVFQFFIFYSKWPWTHPPTSKFFLLFGFFFNFATSLSLYNTCNKILGYIYIQIMPTRKKKYRSDNMKFTSLVAR